MHPLFRRVDACNHAAPSPSYNNNNNNNNMMQRHFDDIVSNWVYRLVGSG
jgi:hypothetical protein